MFKGRHDVATNSFDEGDAPPIQPSDRANEGHVAKRASRLKFFIQQAKSFQSMDDIDLTQATIPASSLMYDAQDRTDEENYLEMIQQRRRHIYIKDSEKYATQILFGNKRPSAISRREFSYETARNDIIEEHETQNPKHESQRKRRIVLVVLIFLLLALTATAVIVALQKSRIGHHQPKSLTPQDQSTTSPNPSPSVDNNRTFDSISTFLRTFTTVDDQYFQDATKPQYQAIRWMADIDTLTYSIPESTKDDTYIDIIQRYALAVLFYSMNGDQWDDLSYFLQSTHACSWNYERLMIEDKTMKVGVTCNGKNEVTALIMRTYILILILNLISAT
jgi:hypothetical protein